MKSFLRYLFLVPVLFIGLSFGANAYAASPTSVKITLYKTELFNGSTWVTVFNNATGIPVDLVTNPGSILGSGNISAGIYDGLRLTIANELLFSGTNTVCTGSQTATDQALLIDDTLSPTAQTTANFATAVTGGATAWYADSSAARPLLMTAPIEVVSGATIEVSLMFNLRDTLECNNSGDIAMGPPSIDVLSRLKAVVYDFPGGDYWFMEFASNNAKLRDLMTGIVIEPAIVNGVSNYETLLSGPNGESYAAQMRGNSWRGVVWGMKVRLSPPDVNGQGSVYFLRDYGYHRHRLDESTCAPNCVSENLGAVAAGTTDITPVLVGNYSLGADNRVNITLPDGNVVGAISSDFELLTLVNLNSPSQSGLRIGVQVSTTAPVFGDGLFSWSGYDFRFSRPFTGGIADWAYTGQAIGWVDFLLASPPDTIETNWYRPSGEMVNPTYTSTDLLLPFSSSNFQSNDYYFYGPSSIAPPPPFNLGADGTAIINLGTPAWLAVSPDSNIGIMASGTSDIETTNLTHETHFLGYSLALRQAAPGTHSTAGLAGRYIWAGMWDELNTGSNPRNGGSYGMVTLNADGTFVVQGVENDQLGIVNPFSGAGTFAVESRCYGLTSAARDASVRLHDGTSLPGDEVLRDDPVNRLDPTLSAGACSSQGGRSMEVAVMSEAGVVTVIATIDANARVLNFYNTEILLDSPGANRRSLGHAVRLR